MLLVAAGQTPCIVVLVVPSRNKKWDRGCHTLHSKRVPYPCAQDDYTTLNGNRHLPGKRLMKRCCYNLPGYSNQARCCKTRSDHCQYRATHGVSYAVLCEVVTSLRFSICVKSIAIRSRSWRACESVSIRLLPRVITVAALLRSCVKRTTSSTSTPTLTTSSANVKPCCATPL